MRYVATLGYDHTRRSRDAPDGLCRELDKITQFWRARLAVRTARAGRREAPQRVRAGETVWIAPNERHWHGATSSTLMSHTTTTIGATEFHEAVTEAEYAAANATSRS
jgi:hypothetical protein